MNKLIKDKTRLMMNRNIASIVCCISALTSMAQTETPDSIKSEVLDEVVVKAQMQSTNSTSSTYIPLSRQKNAATDAISLLSQMAIPQLEVQPGNFSVKTISGQNVAIYIDYVVATEQDLSGLRPTDVKKVEYLLYPQDPRFKGAQYVVNFIMQKYEWGGYTKLTADKWFGVNHTEGSVYSKFVYKAMTFDLFADEKYLTDRHFGKEMTETFRFPDLYGQGPQYVERYTTPLSSRYRHNINDVTFRALYSSDKTQISNKLSFNLTSTPRNNFGNSLSYANDFLPTSTASTVASSRNRGLHYDFEIYSQLNDKLTLNVETWYKYGHNKQDSRYTDDDLSIVNNAREESHVVNLTPCLVWTPNQHNRIMLIPGGEFHHINIDYLGSSPSRQRYDVLGTGGGINYTFTQSKWTAGSRLRWMYTVTDLTGIVVKDNYPQGRVFGTYSPNDHHQFELMCNFGKEIPDTYQKSPNMLQQDQLIWYAGNADLKNYWNHHFGMQYLWLPSNNWQVAGNASYFTAKNKVVALYSPDAPNGTMLRRYVNDGNNDIAMTGFSVTGKFFGGKLVAKLHPQYWHRRISGGYNLSLDEVTCTAQLSWYFGNFYLFGWYMTPNTYIPDDTGIRERTPSSYQIQLGWGKGAWRASATAHNFLRSSWEIQRQHLSGQYYGFDRHEFGTDQHMRFQFSVTYTIGYGKKVQQGNEVGAQQEASSAILK